VPTRLVPPTSGTIVQCVRLQRRIAEDGIPNPIWLSHQCMADILDNAMEEDVNSDMIIAAGAFHAEQKAVTLIECCALCVRWGAGRAA